MSDRWTLAAIAACLGLGSTALATMNTRWVPAVLAERAAASGRERALVAASVRPSEPQAPGATVASDGAQAAARPADSAPGQTREAQQIVYFDPDRDVLDAAARDALDALAARMGDAGALRLVEIDGHADRRGESDHNVELSARRAERVAAHLRERGVPAELVRLRALGESQPADPRFTARAYRLNRRVVVRYRWEEP